MTFIRKNAEPEKFWNKLVRDKVPHICHGQGLITVTRGLGDREYLKELRRKVREEKAEYRAAVETQDRLEELADILEVTVAIRNVLGEINAVKRLILFIRKEREKLSVSVAHLEQVRKKKANERGAFNDRIFLISTKGAQ